MTFADKSLTCRDCGVTFVWTAGEQEFYASRGLENPPGRCPSCRAARKARSEANGASSYGGYTAGGYSTRSERGNREFHITVCAGCGGEARVPFVPRGDRPVYCSNCFERTRSTASSYVR